MYEGPQRHEVSFLLLVSPRSSHSGQPLYQRPYLQHPSVACPAAHFYTVHFHLPFHNLLFGTAISIPQSAIILLKYNFILPFHYPHESLSDSPIKKINSPSSECRSSNYSRELLPRRKLRRLACWLVFAYDMCTLNIHMEKMNQINKVLTCTIYGRGV